MAGHSRPVDVRVNGLSKPDGVAGEKKEPAERFDLVEIALNIDAIFAHQRDHRIGPVAVSRALNACDFVEEGRQDATPRIPDTGESEGVVADPLFYARLGMLKGPFMDALFGVMNIAIEILPVV